MNNKEENNEQNHPSFPQPPKIESKVWRYMDLPKFIVLLEKRKLFFPRADLLRDPHEGSITPQSKQMLKEFWQRHGSKDIDEVMSPIHLKARTCTYISCWHMNNTESEAMWKIYCPSNQGVAIQTTYNKLKKSLRENDKDIFIGMVRYLEYDKDFFQIGNTFAPFMHKRSSFSFENEVRALKQLYQGFKQKEMELPLGIEIEWNISEVIDHIYINSYSEKWYSEVIKAVVRAFAPELESKIMWSILKSTPLY